MRALQLVGAGVPLIDVEVADPEPGPGDVVVAVEAAGICRSDTHYRAGDPRLPPLPRILGHEVAGIVDTATPGSTLTPGTRVGLHYQVGCGRCAACEGGEDRFCGTGEMIGNQRDGGFADKIVIPERNAIPIPDGIDLTHAAVMMCSSVTALHALHRGRLRRGERVAVFGAGGLGMSAIQLALAMGASEVFAVDLDADRLTQAGRFGAVAVDATMVDAVTALQDAGGVDVAVELIGLPHTIGQAVQSLRPRGRAAVAGLTSGVVPISVYDDLMGREAELIGVMDHTIDEVRQVLNHAVGGELDLGPIVTGTVPLDASAVNERLDHLEVFGAGVRTVIVPGAAATA